MSEKLLRSPSLGGLIRDTTANMPKTVHMAGMDRLLRETTGGMSRMNFTAEGIITDTVPPSMRGSTPALLPQHETDKTPRLMSFGGTYAGKVSGYGEKNKTKSKK